MEKDIYGRRICDENCVAFFIYKNVPYCDANEMFFTKRSILCKLSPKYTLTEVNNDIKDKI